MPGEYRVKYKKEAEELWLETLSFAEVGNSFGITRQAVELRIKRSKNPIVRETYKNRKQLIKEKMLSLRKPNCQGCGRSFLKIRWYSRNLCSSCKNRHIGLKEIIFIPIKEKIDSCIDCGKPFKEVRFPRRKDRCLNCYKRSLKFTDPMQWSKILRYQRLRNREKVKKEGKQLIWK